MPIFTGYEPNNLVGKGPGNAPIALGPARQTQTTGSASSSSAAQIVPADDLSNLFDAEMSSLLEDLFEEPLVPLADSHVVQSGLKGLAASLGPIQDKPAISATAGAPKDVEHHGASIKKQARISAEGKPKDDGHHGKPTKQARFSEQLGTSEDSGTPKDDGHHGSSPSDNFPSTSQSSTCKSGLEELAIISDTAKDDFQSTSQSSVVAPGANPCLSGLKGLAYNVASTDAIVTADRVDNLETEIALLRSALDAKDLELSETKVHAESYASKALQDSRDKAEKALAFQKRSFDTAHAEYSLMRRMRRRIRTMMRSMMKRSEADCIVVMGAHVCATKKFGIYSFAVSEKAMSWPIEIGSKVIGIYMKGGNAVLAQ